MMIALIIVSALLLAALIALYMSWLALQVSLLHMAANGCPFPTRDETREATRILLQCKFDIKRNGGKNAESKNPFFCGREDR